MDRHASRGIGQTQAWYYPADRLVLLWECYLVDRFSTDDPRIDATLAALWTAFERFLIERFPAAERIATTWEDTYEHTAWQTFLAKRGYYPISPAAFIKLLVEGR